MKDIAVIASTYGEGAYSACDYSTGQVSGHCTAASGAAQSNSGLANTGLGLLAVVTIVCLIVFISVFIRFWRRKRTNFQNIEVLENHRQTERH